MERHLLPILKYLTARYPEDADFSLCMSRFKLLWYQQNTHASGPRGEQPNTLAGPGPKPLRAYFRGCCLFISFRLSHFVEFDCTPIVLRQKMLINPHVLILEGQSHLEKKSEPAPSRSHLHPSTCSGHEPRPATCCPAGLGLTLNADPPD